MILEKSMQAQFLIPMAVSLGYGVLFATGITLLLVPCGYGILDDILNLMAREKPQVSDDATSPEIVKEDILEV